MMMELEKFKISFVKFISFCLQSTSIDFQFYFFDVHKIYDSLRYFNWWSIIDLEPIKSGGFIHEETACHA